MRIILVTIFLIFFVYSAFPASVLFEINDDSVNVITSDSIQIKGEIISVNENRVIGKFPGLGKVTYKKKDYNDFKFKNYKRWYRDDFDQAYSFLGSHTALRSNYYPINIRTSFPPSILLDMSIIPQFGYFVRVNGNFIVFNDVVPGVELGIKSAFLENNYTALSAYISASFKPNTFEDGCVIGRLGVSNSLTLKERFVLHSNLTYQYNYCYYYELHEYHKIFAGISVEYYLFSRMKIILEYNGNVINTEEYDYYNRFSSSKVATGFRFIFNNCVINLGGGLNRLHSLGKYKWKPFPKANISILLGKIGSSNK